MAHKNTGGVFTGVVQGLLGFRLGYGGIEVSPFLPAQWEYAHLTITLRGARYKVDIERNGARGHSPLITVDGPTHIKGPLDYKEPGATPEDELQVRGFGTRTPRAGAFRLLECSLGEPRDKASAEHQECNQQR